MSTFIPAGGKARISGTLTSADPACGATQVVTLMKGTKVLSSPTTDNTGLYKASIRVKRKTTVHASFAGTATCAASVSPDKIIKVT